MAQDMSNQAQGEVSQCCADWQKARKSGTDNEGFSRAVWNINGPHDDPDWRIGTGMGQVQFCPWCGARKQ